MGVVGVRGIICSCPVGPAYSQVMSMWFDGQIRLHCAGTLEIVCVLS